MHDLQFGVEALGLAAGDALGAHRMAAFQTVAEHLEPAQEGEPCLIRYTDAVGMAGPPRLLVCVHPHAQGGDFALLHLGDPSHAPVHQAGGGQEQQVAHALARQLGHQRTELGAEALQRAHVGEQRKQDFRTHGGWG